MALYTVHVPSEAPDIVTRADRTVLIREGFSLSAFVFGVLFLLWHRLWIAAACWVALLAAVVGISAVLHPPGIFAFGLTALMHLFLGVEGNDLRRWGLERRGFHAADVVFGAVRDEAELVFFNRPPARAPDPPRASSRQAPAAIPEIIGMFPEASGS